MSNMIRVGMADYRLCRPPQKISTLGLGSCLGVILYDQRLKICGLAHVMMPSSQLIRKNANRMKFVDTCLKDMFEELLKQGSRKENMIAKMAGGAQMFVNQNTHNMLISVSRISRRFMNFWQNGKFRLWQRMSATIMVVRLSLILRRGNL